MLIAISLFVIGFVVSLRARIVVLVPIGVFLIFGLMTAWSMVGDIDQLKIAILIGYIFLLNSGYLVGAAFAKEGCIR